MIYVLERDVLQRSNVVFRYWRAGPGPWGRSGLWTYSYLNFGFVFLQDLVERTLLDVLVNKTVSEPGIYVQQFPYPCYIRDR